MIRPTLDTWDKNYQTLQSEYEPWKQLGDYDQVTRNLQLVQQMNQDPQAFYERLGQLIGVTPNQAQQITQNGGVPGQEAQQNQGLYGTGEEDYLVDPEVAQLQADCRSTARAKSTMGTRASRSSENSASR